jgi:hypothetical protein
MTHSKSMYNPNINPNPKQCSRHEWEAFVDSQIFRYDFDSTTQQQIARDLRLLTHIMPIRRTNDSAHKAE